MEITEEMRRAVYMADCDEMGHQPDYSGAATFEGRRIAVRAPDELQLPHITCVRCKRVWVVMPTPGWSYEDAERALYAVLRADTGTARDITRNRGKREQRDRPPTELTPLAEEADPGRPGGQRRP